ncbi:MAG: tetratricopeptide repeat protein [Deltaproteobacteria bacterium]|nr:MAG: tetratricopeptide repeat protein [Deltaproteobacteria bacterium]
MGRRYSDILSACALVAVVALLYGHTLQVPFYLDDEAAIVNKYPLRDLTATLFDLLSQRGLTNLSFALNYRLSGLSLAPLHLTNILLHAFCSLLVWQLLRRLLPQRPELSLLGALLFVAHPLQTQAVTYLVQRAALLGTLFFLVAFLLHLRVRQLLAEGWSLTSSRCLGYWSGAVIAGACAVLAKENTATLPVVLFVFDRIFPLSDRQRLPRATGYYLPYLIMPLLMGGLLLARLGDTGGAAALYAPLASLQHNSPLNYLVTQFSVVWIYLLLLLLPFGQALEHDYPVVADLLNVKSFLALAALAGVAWILWRLRQRRPLLVFGAAWFVLGLAVESSLIPLDPLFEHRLYLPMFGFLLVVLDGCRNVMAKRTLLAVLGGVVVIHGILTWQRNALWRDPVAFYEDNLRVYPSSERAGEHLATLYSVAGRYDEEIRLLERMLKLYPENTVMRNNLAKAYGERQRYAEAYAQIDEGLRLNPAAAEYYETASALASVEGDPERAIAWLHRGLTVAGVDRGRLWNDLGILFSDLGEAAAAERAFAESLKEDGASARVWVNLGNHHSARGQWQAASNAFQTALRLEPGNPESLEGLGRSALQLDDRELAYRVAAKLEHADPETWDRLQRAMRKVGW